MGHLPQKLMEIGGKFWKFAIFNFKRSEYFLSFVDVFLFVEVGSGSRRHDVK